MQRFDHNVLGSRHKCLSVKLVVLERRKYINTSILATLVDKLLGKTLKYTFSKNKLTLTSQ